MPPFYAVADRFEEEKWILSWCRRQVEIQARDLTESRPHFGPFNLPETPVWRQRAQHCGMKPKNARHCENHFPFDEEI